MLPCQLLAPIACWRVIISVQKWPRKSDQGLKDSVHDRPRHEFVGGIAQFSTEGATVRLPSALMQPIVSDDVAVALADVAIAEPLNDTVEVAGPEPIRMDDLVRRFLSANGDPRNVITDVHAPYYGIEVNDQSLTPGKNPRLGPTRFEDWLSHSIPQK
jgi:uncharacterized protein YbjT (DUF2867 family)